MKKLLSQLAILSLLFTMLPQSLATTFTDSTTPTPIQWADLDPNQEIILLSDLAEYYKEMDRLAEEEKYDEMQWIEPTRHFMSEPEVAEYFKIPETYYPETYYPESDPSLYNNSPSNYDSTLYYTPELYKVGPALSTDNYGIDAYTEPIFLDLENAQPTVTKDSAPSVTIYSNSYTNTLPTYEPPPTEKEQTFFEKLINSIPTETAHADNHLEIPIITLEDAFTGNAVSDGLYYISKQQNDDGSFGSTNIYKTTSDVLDLLEFFNKTDNSQYDAALAYLVNTTPQNNREKAIKIRILISHNLQYQNLLDELNASQDRQNGGFGLDKYYPPDLETTLEAVLALKAASAQAALAPALLYVTNSVRPDGSIIYTADSDPNYYLANKTAQTLSHFKGLAIAVNGQQVRIQTKIDSIVNFLAPEAQLHDQSDSASLLRTLELDRPNFEIEEQLRNHLFQNLNGSFDNSLETTAIALPFLATPDLRIDGITPTTNLINKELAGFDIEITNIGSKPAKEGTLYFFFDSLKLDYQLNFQDHGLIIQPGSTSNVHINFPNTNSFIGITEINLYLESSKDLNHENNWYKTNVNFASALNGTPALPGFYIAQNHQIGDDFRINIRFPKKQDPNRDDYLVMIREKGTVEWQYIRLIDDVIREPNEMTGAFFGNFQPGLYEVTVGSIHRNNVNYLYYNEFTDVLVGPDGVDEGSISGVVTDSDKPAISASIGGIAFNATSDQSGVFLGQSVPNGSTLVWVDNPQYEKLMTKTRVLPNQETSNVRVFSRLKEDNAPPIIEHFSIHFEEDMIFRNQTTSQLFVRGSDDVAIEYANFAYYDPASNSWHDLGNK